jgi:cyclic nucleotide-binding protein/uncharacterized protein DUF2225
MYVICSGSVRAYRQSLNKPGAIEELARLGLGDIVGEMAAMLKQLRSATLQALESTEVLEVPAVLVGDMLKQHQSLLRVLEAALKDRAGLSHQEVEEIVSGTNFFALVVHPQKDMPAQRSSDFHQTYQTPFNPYDYEVWVCPNDRYAALPQDFGRCGARLAGAGAASLRNGGQPVRRPRQRQNRAARRLSVRRAECPPGRCSRRAALRWCTEGLRHSAVKEYPHCERMLRDQWATIRAASG